MKRGGGWVIAQSILLLAVVALGVVFQGDWTRLPVIVGGAVIFALVAPLASPDWLFLEKAAHHSPGPQSMPGWCGTEFTP